MPVANAPRAVEIDSVTHPRDIPLERLPADLRKQLDAVGKEFDERLTKFNKLKSIEKQLLEDLEVFASGKAPPGFSPLKLKHKSDEHSIQVPSELASFAVDLSGKSIEDAMVCIHRAAYIYNKKLSLAVVQAQSASIHPLIQQEAFIRNCLEVGRAKASVVEGFSNKIGITTVDFNIERSVVSKSVAQQLYESAVTRLALADEKLAKAQVARNREYHARLERAAAAKPSDMHERAIAQTVSKVLAARNADRNDHKKQRRRDKIQCAKGILDQKDACIEYLGLLHDRGEAFDGDADDTFGDVTDAPPAAAKHVHFDPSLRHGKGKCHKTSSVAPSPSPSKGSPSKKSKGGSKGKSKGKGSKASKGKGKGKSKGGKAAWNDAAARGAASKSSGRSGRKGGKGKGQPFR